MIKESLLKTVSIGIVAKDIPEDEVYVDIYPIELQPNKTGELTESDELETTITNIKDEVENIVISKTNLIKAKWMPDGDTNRLEPPTVCKGEVVRLFQYSDDDKYYWKPLYNQLDLRKLEKRTIVLSNKQSIEVDPSELLEYSYFAQMDTINKLVHLRTSDTDEEYTTYDFHLDTKEGVLTIIDGKDNQIVLESQDDRLTIKTNKEIVIETTDQMIKINNDRTCTVDNNDVLTVNNNKTTSVSNHYQINVSTYAVDNGRDELIQTLMDFVQAVHDAIGIGNLGAPVPMDGGTKSNLQAIKQRFGGFKR